MPRASGDYVESLSAYARQFLGQMEKPHFDSIRGLSPAISIEQKAQSNNPRSTVGTITEVHDYLRVLFARIGLQHCPICGRLVGKQTAQQIVEEIEKLPKGEKILLLAPVVRDRKGEHREILQDALKRGFSRARIDGTVHDLADAAALHLDKKVKHDIELVIDRLVIKEGLGNRLTDSVETALREGKGLLIIGAGATDGNREKDRVMSELLACIQDGLSFNELTPQAFSFNNPLGMCVECNGLGTRAEMDADLVVPNPALSIREGAVEPWASGMARGDGWTADLVNELARAGKIDLDKPWKDLPKAKREMILRGDGDVSIEFRWSEEGETRRYRRVWEGLLPMLMRRMKQSSSEGMRRWYQRFLSNKPCIACEGARLNPVSRAVKVGGLGIDALCRLTIGEARDFLNGLTLKSGDRKVADELLKEIRARLGFLLDVGLSDLTLERGASSLSGGEAQRIRLASQIGSELSGVIYILDEPSIGLHQRDNGKLLITLKRLRDLGNSVIVVEHDRETMEQADWLVDFGPGAGILGGEVIASDTPARVAENPRSITGQYLSGTREIQPPSAAPRPITEGALASPRREREQPQEPRRRDPARHDGGSHRRFRRGQEHAHQRDRPAGALARADGILGGCRCPQGGRGGAVPRQGDRHRSAAHRSHAAFQSRHLHQGLRFHPQSLRRHSRGAGLRVWPRALQLQRQGRPLRGVRGRRPQGRGDALPRRRLRDLRRSATASASTMPRCESATKARTSPRCSSCRSRKRSSCSESTTTWCASCGRSTM